MTQPTTLAELLADSGSPAPAIIASSPLAVVSYKALAGQIEMLAEKLRNAGLKPGESVAMVLPNCLEFLVIFLALTRARLVAAPTRPASCAFSWKMDRRGRLSRTAAIQQSKRRRRTLI
jgi:acyl-CoA synthetase (AMP-forming)/AMP-acid ligase II